MTSLTQTRPSVPSKETERRTALVTGASSGIGAAFAKRLAGDGYDLIIVARRRDRLEALAHQLQSETGVGVNVLAADLTDREELRDIERAAAESPALDLLVNCAGAGGYMPFVELPADDAEELIRLHIIATTRLTRAALPGMIARGHGVVVNVSSALAFSASLPAPPLPQRAVYASCKSYINTFSEILANELKGTGVQVQALCPGIVRTEFHEVGGYDVSHVPFMLSPEDVVTASLAAVALGEAVCMPAMQDTALLNDLAESRGRLLGAARGSAIADRYQKD